MATSVAAILVTAGGAKADPPNYVYTAGASNTEATPDLWSAGTGWDFTPASGTDTVLTLGGSLGDGATVFTSDDLPGNFTLNRLAITVAGTGSTTAGAFTLLGGPLEFVATSGGVKPTLTIAPTGTLRPSVAIKNDLILSDDLTVSVATSAAGTLSGVISGAGQFIKTGGGNLFVSGANTYTGNTSVTGGILIVSNANGLGSTSGTTEVNGGQLTLSGGITVTGETITINGLGTGNTGALSNSSGSNTWAGNVIIGTPSAAGSNNAARVGANGGTLNISGVIQDGASNNIGIRSADTGGAVIFSGANTYTGTTHIVVGNLTVTTLNSVETNATLGTVHSASSNLGAPTTAANGLLYFSSGNAITGGLIYNGPGETTDRGIVLFGSSTGAVIDNSGTGALKFLGNVTAPGAAATDNRKSLTLQGSTAGTGELAGIISDSVLGTAGQTTTSIIKQGTGTWILSGANTFSGRITINNGILSVGSLNSVATDAGLGTTHLNSSNLGAPTTVALGTIALGSVTSTAQLLYTGAGETTDRVLNLAGTTGNITITQNGTGLLKFVSPLTATGVGDKTLILQGSGDGEFAGAIVNSLAKKTAISKAGTGTWTLSTANSYTGTTTVSGGTLAVTAAGGINGSTISVTGGTLALGAAGAVTASPITITSGGYTQSVANTITGASSFTLNGASLTQVMNLANDYTGATTITSGTLRAGAANVFAPASAFSLGGAAAVLDLNGFNQSLASLASTNGNVQLGSATLTVGSDNTSTSNTAVISGAGGLVKVGTGVLTLTATNLFTGGVVIKAGTLSAGANAASFGGNGTGTITLGDSSANTDAGLRLDSSTVTYANPVTVANAGTGVLTLSNNNSTTVTLNGAITLNHDLNVQSNGTGSVTLGGGFTGTGNLVINNSGTTSATTLKTVLVNNAGTITNTGASTGSTTISSALGSAVTGLVQNSATSKLVLSGNNAAFTGPLTISAGTVQAGATTALSASNNVRLDSTGTLDLNAFSITVGGLDGVTATAGTVTNTGAAKVLTLGGSGTYTYGGALTATTPANLALTVALTGTGKQTYTGAATYTGATLVNSGTLALSTGSLAGTAVTVGTGTAGNATLSVAGNYTIGTASAGNLTIKGGTSTTGQGTLSLQDGALNTLTLANTASGTLTLGGTATNASILNFDLGDATFSDRIAVGTTLTVNAGGAVINLNKITAGGVQAGNYTLLTYTSATGADLITIGATPTVAAGKMASYTLSTASSTALVLTVGLADVGATAYWTGSQGTNWNTINGSLTNFTLNADGTGGSVLPDGTSDVYFAANTSAATTANNVTKLGQDFAVKSLNFLGTGSAAAATAYTIGGGSTLTIGAGGIVVDTNSANHTLSTNVALGANQIWSLGGTVAQTLTVSGGISGNFNVTVDGGRKLVLTGANTYGGTTINAGATVQVGNAGTSGSLGAGAVANAGTLLFSRTDAALNVASVISGAGTITKQSTGTVTLSGANTYTGLTTVSQGILVAANPTALGANSTNGGQGTTVAASAQLQLSGGITIANETLTLTAGPSTGTNVIPNSLLNVSGNNEWAGAITLASNGANNARVSSTSGTLTISGNIDGSGLPSTQALVVTGTSNIIISGALSGSLGLINTGSGASVVTLSGANTYGGYTAFQSGGVYVVSSLNNSGTGGLTQLASSSLGKPSSTSTNVIDFGNSNGVTTGTIRYVGTGETTDRVLKMTGTAGTATVDQSGTGTLKFTSNLSNTTAGAKTLALTGSSAGIGEISGNLVNGTGGTSVTKSGTGTWILSGTGNTYTGATAVTAGTLVVSGSLSGTSGVTVSSGATLASGRNLTSAVTAVTLNSDATGGGTLAPGNTGGTADTSTIGKLTVNGALTLGTAATAGVARLAIELGGTTAGSLYDQVAATGNVSLNNVALDLSFVNGFRSTIAENDTFYIILNGGGSTLTQFTNDTNGFLLAGGQVFAVSYTANYNNGSGSVFSGGGHDIALRAIPEPSAMGSVLLGLASLAGLQRFRRRAVAR